MPVVDGQLRDGMRTYREKGFNVLVMLIDEQGPGSKTAVHDEQRRILEYARDEQFPIWLVETLSGEQIPPTRPDLLAGLVLERRILKKQTSGFSGTNLELYLQAKGANIIVMMGYAANQCVRYTAAGGFMTSEGREAYKAVTAAVNAAKQKNEPLGPAASAAVTEWVKGRETTSYCPGATQRGFVVLTSQKILSGGPAVWEHEENAFFYTEV